MTLRTTKPASPSRPNRHRASHSSHNDTAPGHTDGFAATPTATLRANPHMRLARTTCHGAKSPFAHTRTCDTRQTVAQPTGPTPQIIGRAYRNIHNTTNQPQTNPPAQPTLQTRMPRHTQPGKSCINRPRQRSHSARLRPTDQSPRRHMSHLVCRRIHHRSEVLSQKLVHKSHSLRGAERVHRLVSP